MSQYCIGKNKELRSDEIPELGGTSELICKKEILYQEETSSLYKFDRPPILCEIFKDPETKIDKCLVVATMFAGTSNFNFEIGEDGETVKLNFEWPNPMFNIGDIFKEISAEGVPNYHPKYLALENALEGVRSYVDEKPQGSIEVKLPLPVQNLSSTWTKKLINSKGCTVLYLELTGFQTKYVVKKDERAFK